MYRVFILSYFDFKWRPQCPICSNFRALLSWVIMRAILNMNYNLQHFFDHVELICSYDPHRPTHLNGNPSDIKIGLRIIFLSFRMIDFRMFWGEHESQKWTGQAKCKEMNKEKHLFTLIHCRIRYVCIGLRRCLPLPMKA